MSGIWDPDNHICPLCGAPCDCAEIVCDGFCYACSLEDDGDDDEEE